RVVLDPPRAREVLAVLALPGGDGAAAVVEQDRARARGALIDRQDVPRGHRATRGSTSVPTHSTNPAGSGSSSVLCTRTVVMPSAATRSTADATVAASSATTAVAPAGHMRR